MALRIYDIGLDELRDCTQADIDTLCAVRKAYGALREAVARVHTQLLADVTEIGVRAAANISPEAKAEDK